MKTPMCVRALHLDDAADIARALIQRAIPFNACGTYFQVPGAHASAASRVIDATLSHHRYVITLESGVL